MVGKSIPYVAAHGVLLIVYCSAQSPSPVPTQCTARLELLTHARACARTHPQEILNKQTRTLSFKTLTHTSASKCYGGSGFTGSSVCCEAGQSCYLKSSTYGQCRSTACMCCASVLCDLLEISVRAKVDLLWSADG